MIHDTRNNIYLCRNEREWNKLMDFLAADSRHRWGTQEIYNSNGKMFFTYLKGEREAVFVQRNRNLTLDCLDYALSNRGQEGYDDVLWVSDFLPDTVGKVLSKPVLPHL